jgi:hypothetical protein
MAVGWIGVRDESCYRTANFLEEEEVAGRKGETVVV